jgi:DNA-binding CsgD family transcriptional regulator
MNEITKQPDETQRKVIQMLANDLSHAQIAVELDISVRTVETLTKKIRDYWGIKSLPAICVLFYRKGWIV